MRRIGIIAIGAMLVAVGCSSGSGSGEATDAPAGSATSAPESTSDPGAAPTAAASDPLATFRDAEAIGVVDIGGQRYEFEGLYCVNIGGAMGASSVGGDPSVRFDIPPEDWETSAQDWDPPSISLSIDDPYVQWVAGGDVVTQLPKYRPGISQVDTFTTDGYRASGSATFVDTANPTADLTPVTATFDVSCPRK